MTSTLYHIVNGQQIQGPHSKLTGETYGLVGDCTNVYGKSKGIHGDVTNLFGNISNLRGLVSVLLTGVADNVYGYVNWITGSLSNICGALSPVFRNTNRTNSNTPNFGMLTGQIWTIKDDPDEKECVRGDVSKLEGNVSRTFGEVGDLEGEVTKLIGDWSRISGKSKKTLRGFIKPSLTGDISDLDGDISAYDKVPKKKPS